MAIFGKQPTLVSVQEWESSYETSGSNAATITTGATWNIRFTDEVVKQWSPFSVLSVRNLDTSCELAVYLDGDASRWYPVPPNSLLIIPPEDGLKFTWIDVKNTHASATVGISSVLYNVRAMRNRGKLVSPTR